MYKVERVDVRPYTPPLRCYKDDDDDDVIVQAGMVKGGAKIERIPAKRIKT